MTATPDKSTHKIGEPLSQVQNKPRDAFIGRPPSEINNQLMGPRFLFSARFQKLFE